MGKENQKRIPSSLYINRIVRDKTVNGCKDVSKCLRKMNSEDGQVYSVFIL